MCSFCIVRLTHMQHESSKAMEEKWWRYYSPSGHRYMGILHVTLLEFKGEIWIWKVTVSSALHYGTCAACKLLIDQYDRERKCNVVSTFRKHLDGRTLSIVLSDDVTKIDCDILKRCRRAPASRKIQLSRHLRKSCISDPKVGPRSHDPDPGEATTWQLTWGGHHVFNR